MATSINKLITPAALQPVYNPVVSVVTSSNQTEEGFQFIFDIFSASTGSRISRVKMPQNPDGYGVYDAHRILENYVSYDLVPTATGVTNALGSRFKYDIQFGEEYIFNWPFYDNYSSTGSYLGFTSHTAHYFSVGDRIYVEQDAGYLYEEYNGYFTVTSASTYSIATDYTPFSSTPVNAGSISYADSRKTIFSGITAASGLTVCNAAFSHLDWRNYSASTYDLTGGTKAFLTDAPENYEMQLGNRAWLLAYCSSATTGSGSSQIKAMIVQTYEQNGAQLGAYYLTGISHSDIFVKVGVGPWNLSATTLSTSGSSTLPVFTTAVTSYSVFLADRNEAPLSERKVFSLNQDCSKYNNIELVFMDRKGSWLTRNFQLASRQNADIKRSEYKAPIGKYNGTTWTYNTYDRGRTNFNVDIERKFKATSNWMSESDAAYIEQLFSSPEVYQNNSGTFIPLIITSNNFEVKTTINNKLINYEIEFVYAFNDEVQRG